MELEIKEIVNMFERSDLQTLERGKGLIGFSEAFKTDLRNGISKAEAESNYEERKKSYGINKLPDPPVKSWFKFFLESFHGITLKILLVSAVIFAVFETIVGLYGSEGHLSITNYIDAIAIVVVVLIVGCTTAQTNYSQQKSYLEINKLKNSFQVTVVRAGERVQISSTEVLVGDILELMAGDCVAADALYINGTNLSINNSAQTGESVAVKINEKNPFIKGGGAVESGIATCLVCAVGENAQSGVMMKKIHDLEQKQELSPLQKKLDLLGKQLALVASCGCALTFIILLIKFIVDITKVSGSLGIDDFIPLLEAILISITIFLCCIPEGLPLAVTLSLAFSMKKMMADQNFVRNLSACETMGGATTICSDKTGTLTQNKMTVVRFFQDGFEGDGKPDLEPDMINLISECVAINSTATHTIKNDSEDIIYVGSSSECALLQMIAEYGRDYQELRELNPIVYLNEFNSARKRMSAVIRKEAGFRCYFKGAPDFCLPLCSKYMTKDGKVKKMTQEYKQNILNKITEWADQSFRTLLLAYRDLGTLKPEFEDPNYVEKDLTFICIVGIIDPLRPEVMGALEKCRSAGVVVRMVTGDFINTARAISKECGIVQSEEDVVMEGRDFASMSKLELLDVLPRLRVLARSSPTDKYRLVSLLMEMGEVVAVTGDGSNDSAALKKANVGLSMGQCGTELAKIASDIVILDDNFSSIVNALKWGRTIYDNLRSFLLFQIPTNFVAIIVAIIGTLYLGESPLKPVQILWINIFNDSLGALALATRGPTPNLLNRPPYGESDSLLSRYLLKTIGIHAFWQVFIEVVTMFLYDRIYLGKKGDLSGLTSQISSCMFNLFVFLNVFNLINCRAAHDDVSVFGDLFATPYFPCIWVAIVVLQAIIVCFPNDVFRTTKTSGREWGFVLLFAFVEMIIHFGICRTVKIPEVTTQKLNDHRAQCKEVVKDYYSGMSTEEQWDDRYAIGCAAINVEGKIAADYDKRPKSAHPRRYFGKVQKTKRTLINAAEGMFDHDVDEEPGL